MMAEFRSMVQGEYHSVKQNFGRTFLVNRLMNRQYSRVIFVSSKLKTEISESMQLIPHFSPLLAAHCQLVTACLSHESPQFS